MRRLIVASIGMLAIGVTTASAADIRARPRPAPPPPPVYFSWTGCYVGGNVGALWVHREFTDRLVGDPFFGQTFTSTNTSGIGGVQVGCNYQFAGGWVVGIQGDYDWTDAHTNGRDAFFANFTDSFKVKSVASVTGRVGYAWDRLLGYVKGGGAWERDDFTFTFPSGATATFSDTRSGWTVGVGVEYAFTNWLTGFIEYDYYNFGTRSDNVVCGPAACFVGGSTLFPFDVKETKNVVKVGLNVLFTAGPGGVAARY